MKIIFFDFCFAFTGVSKLLLQLDFYPVTNRLTTTRYYSSKKHSSIYSRCLNKELGEM